MTTLESLADEQSLDSAFERSKSKPVFVFKHSLVCPISSSAWSRFLAFMNASGVAEKTAFAKIEIQNARDISNAMAKRTAVRHESPQAILLVDGEAVWAASHGGITVESLSDALGRVAS